MSLGVQGDYMQVEVLGSYLRVEVQDNCLKPVDLYQMLLEVQEDCI